MTSENENLLRISGGSLFHVEQTFDQKISKNQQVTKENEIKKNVTARKKEREMVEWTGTWQSTPRT
jgi:hypothetical protein